MIRKTFMDKAQSMVTLMRGYGFVVNVTCTGIVACHPKGITVTINEKRMKVEHPVKGDGDVPAMLVAQQRVAPPTVEWLAARCEEHGL